VQASQAQAISFLLFGHGRSRDQLRGVLPFRRIVNFVLQIKMLIRREYVGDVGNEFHLIAYQRIAGGFFGRCRDAETA